MKMTASDFYFIDHISFVGGVFVALSTYVFGKYWMLFVGFLALNIADYITGYMKAFLANKVNSTAGLKGLVKKFGYWIFVGVAFGLSAIFISLGRAIGIDLGVTINIGYLTLGSLIINEVRSILENLVEAGYKPPKVLTKGLEVANGVLDQVGGTEEEKDDSK